MQILGVHRSSEIVAILRLAIQEPRTKGSDHCRPSRRPATFAIGHTRLQTEACNHDQYHKLGRDGSAKPQAGERLYLATWYGV